MTPKELYERALRGDPDAMKLALPFMKRGAYSQEQASSLRDTAEHYHKEWKEMHGVAKGHGTHMFEFIRKAGNKKAAWHFIDQTRPTKVLCGREVPFPAEVTSEVPDGATIVARNGHTYMEEPFLCQGCRRRLWQNKRESDRINGVLTKRGNKERWWG